MNWSQVSDPGLGQVDAIVGSAANGKRFVVIGNRSDFIQTIWWSADGRAWTEATLPKFDGYPRFNGVAADGSDFVVVGSTDDSNGNYVGMVLTSVDGGKTWLRDGSATLPDWEYWDVAAVGSTIVVTGESTTSHQTEFITSHDSGQTWSQPSDPDGVLGSNSELELMATDTDFWTFALATPDEKAKIAVWRSADGDSWTNQGTLPDSAFFHEGRFSVANGPLGWVAVASTTSNHKAGVAWSSADGSTWQVAPDSPFGNIETIFADDVGFVAVGHWFPGVNDCAGSGTGIEGLTYTSTDGQLWQRMPVDGWMGKLIDQLRRDGRTLIGIGIDYTQNGAGDGAVWTAKLPDTASNAGPAPTNPPTSGNGDC